MKLRHVEMFKKENTLYKNLGDKINGKKVVELNPQLEEVLTHLLERKKLIETLNKDGLTEKELHELYINLDINNAYFESRTDIERAMISELFETAPDSYAKSAEWQNFYMAFLSTASIASYRAVDTLQHTFEDLKNKKAEIDKAGKSVRSQIKAVHKNVPGANPKNAAEKLPKAQEEKNQARQEKRNTEAEFDRIVRDKNDTVTKQGTLSKELQEEKYKKEIYEQVFKEVIHDPDYYKFLPDGKIDKLIQLQNDALMKERETLKEKSPALKKYFEDSEKIWEDERFTFLDDIQEFIDEVYDKGFNENSIVSNVNSDLNSVYPFQFDADTETEKVEQAKEFAKKYTSYIERLTDIYYRNDPDYVKAKETFEKNKRDYGLATYNKKINDLTLKDLSELVETLYQEIEDEIEKKQEQMREQFNDTDKKLYEPHKQKSQKMVDKHDEMKKFKESRAIQRAKDISVTMKNEKYSEEQAKEMLDNIDQSDFIIFINNKMDKIAKNVIGVEYRNGNKVGAPFCLPANLPLNIRPENWLKNESEKAKQNVVIKEKEVSDINLKVSELETKENEAKIKKDEASNKYFDKENEVNWLLKLKDHKKHFTFDAHKVAIKKNCTNTPKLSEKYSSAMISKQIAGQALLKMQEVHKGSHKNSTEFDNMITAMTYVTNWGTKDDMSKYVKDAPKTYQEAVVRLKESIKTYADAKNGQKRLFPSRLRYLRLEMAKVFDMYADTQLENAKDVKMDEKVADSWDKYFETKGKSEVLKFEENASEIGNNQLEEIQKKEPELEEDELDAFEI